MSSEKQHEIHQHQRKAAKEAKEAKETVKSKASQAAHEAHEAAEKAHDELKKHVNHAEGILKPYWDKLVEIVGAVANRTANVGQATVSTVVTQTSKAANIVAQELRNPVVSLNALLAAGTVSTLLRGYANNRRFLKGKTDKDIAVIVSGVSVFVAADAYLSYKYYQQYDRKKY